MTESGAEPVWEPLGGDVRRTLELVLADDSDAHRAYRAQLAHTEMAVGCTCPCGSRYLRVDRSAVAPGPPRGESPVAASRVLLGPDSRPVGEALVFVWGDGYLDELEIATWEDPSLLGRPLWQRVADY